MAGIARNFKRHQAFTLIELLVVISIISLLISILLPSLSRARAQAKGVHCVARLKEFGNALAAYQNISQGRFPPARWYPATGSLDDNLNQPAESGVIEFGWMEIMFSYVYNEEVRVARSYVVQRNIEGDKWEEYFLCKSVGDEGVNSGHYRVYLPAWSAGSYSLELDGVYGESTRANPEYSTSPERVRLKLPLIGDANDMSERGDGIGDDDGSYIDAGEANFAGSNGRNGNRFSDRHYGGTNYLFPDLHAEWNTRLRERLARDYDLNGVADIEVVP